MMNRLFVACALLLASPHGALANMFMVPVAGLSLAKRAVASSPVHVQGCQTNNGATSSATIVCTFGAVVGGGDLVTLFVGLGNPATVASASDDKGDTCTVVDSQAPVGYTTTSLYCANVTAGARTFTVTASAVNQFMLVLGDEYSNVAAISPIDAHAKNYQANPGTGLNAVTTGSVQTTANGDLIVGGTFAVAQPGSITAGSGFVQQAFVSNLAMAESAAQPAAGATAATWTNGNASSGFQSHLLALSPAGGSRSQSISGVTLSNATFAAGALAGTVVGTLSTAMSPSSPPFSGTLSLSGTNAADFQIVGSNLQTAVGGLAAGSYSVNLVATQPGITNSPFSQPETLSATSATVLNHKGIQTFNGQPQAYPQSYLNALAARWQSVGAVWTRLTFWQSDINPSCGTSYNFTTGTLSGNGYDGIMDTFKSFGINTLIDFGGGASCNQVAAGPWTAPSSPTQYAIYAGAVAAHEGARGYHYYEVWNEENACWDWGTSSCSTGVLPDISSYEALLCDVYSAVHANDSQAVVIIGGMGGVIGDPPFWWDARDYLSRIYADGHKNCFDAVGVHPYPNNGPTNLSLMGAGSQWLALNVLNPSIVSTMAANGDSAKPIWSTEVGCWNAGNDSGTCTQAQQTQLVSDLFANAASRVPVEGPVFFWEDHDTGGVVCNSSTVDASTHCAGLWDGNLNPKPSVTAYSNASGAW
jgi:hypothetical protein